MPVTTAWTSSLASSEKAASRVSPWGNEGTRKERLELGRRRAVAKEKSDLPSCLELKEEHRDPGIDEAREGIDDLLTIPGVTHRGREGAKATEEMVDGPRQGTD